MLLDAATDLTLMSIAGQLKVASGNSIIERLADRSKTKASILTDGTLVNSGGSDGSGVGASVIVDIVENAARTVVGADTAIAGKSVAVTADEDFFRLGIAAAGAKNASGGTLGFAGSGQGLDYTSSVLALVLPGSTAKPTTITADAVKVSANSNILNITIAGSLTQGGGGTSVGVSAAVNLIDRLVLAGVGAMPLDRVAPVALGADARDRVTVRAGTVSVSARSGGGTWSFAVAGTVATTPSQDFQTRKNGFPGVNMQQQFNNGGVQINPAFQDGAGIGISGGVGWNELAGQTLAILDAGTITAQSVQVKAFDDTDLIAVTGAAALNLRAKSEGASKTMAGVLSVAESVAVHARTGVGRRCHRRRAWRLCCAWRHAAHRLHRRFRRPVGAIHSLWRQPLLQPVARHDGSPAAGYVADPPQRAGDDRRHRGCAQFELDHRAWRRCRLQQQDRHRCRRFRQHDG